MLKESNQFNTLVEIGTGDGSVLHFLSSKIPEMIRMVGIDLSEIQITADISKYKENPKLEFVVADGFQWVEQNGKSNMIFVTFRGVLEYFTQQRLQGFFKKLDSLGNILFFAVEPNTLSHNFNSNPNSEIYGNESAFSHNCAKLFEDAGFSVWHLSKRIESEHPDVTCIIGAKNF
ncbi:class I SAM-dependent methyltransferase [Maribacter sp. 4U21]|uniref:class I SAM-dependent methyltransferase n=1 Tax=Maribacter sp. 4U21 TaxID=1889779 RepID=UPI000C14CF7D